MLTGTRRGQGKLWVDVGFWGGLVPSNAENSTALAELLACPILGLKAFLSPSGIDDFGNTSLAHWRAALPALAAAGRRPLMVHAELVQHLSETESAPLEGADPRAFSTWLGSRPRRWESDAIRGIIGLPPPPAVPRPLPSARRCERRAR